MNNSMKNIELMAIAEVKTALEAGKVVVIDKKVTADPNYTNLYLFANVDGLGGGSGEVSEAAAMLLGWTGGSQQRAISNAKTEIANKITIGQSIDDVFGASFTLRCIDTVEKQFQTHQPRIDSNGQIFFNGNKEIYRTFELVTKEELDKKGHITLEVTSKGMPKPAEQPMGVSATNVLENAGK